MSDQDGIQLHHGDALAVLRTLADSSAFSVVTDPPYGLSEVKTAKVVAALTAWLAGDREHVPDGRGFMGRQWDRFVPPPAVWDECLRVLKPGGHMLVFAGTRTIDLMGLSIRLAGFEIRDTVTRADQSPHQPLAGVLSSTVMQSEWAGQRLNELSPSCYTRTIHD